MEEEEDSDADSDVSTPRLLAEMDRAPRPMVMAGHMYVARHLHVLCVFPLSWRGAYAGPDTFMCSVVAPYPQVLPL